VKSLGLAFGSVHLPAAHEWEFLQAGGEDVDFDETDAFKSDKTEKTLKVQVWDKDQPGDFVPGNPRDDLLGEYVVDLSFLDAPDQQVAQ